MEFVFECGQGKTFSSPNFFKEFVNQCGIIILLNGRVSVEFLFNNNPHQEVLYVHPPQEFHP